MNKQELLNLHVLYREAWDYVNRNQEDAEYDDLEDAVSGDLPGPLDISASKSDHRRALFAISEHLGDNVGGVKSTDFEYDEEPPEPDIALYRQGDKEHDRIVVNHDSEESVEIDIAETGKHSQKYQTLDDLAKGYDPDEAFQSNYQKPNQRRRKSPYSELDEGDIDKEDLRHILEQSEA
jgi:hypothetical protein